MRKLLLLAILLTGCSQPPPTAVKIEDLPKQEALIGQRVTLDGFIGSSGNQATDSYALPVYNNKLGAGDWRGGHPPVGVMVTGIAVGDGPNQMSKLPDGFSDTHIKVHTASNQVVGVGGPIRVTGTLQHRNPNPEHDVWSLEAPIVFESP